jgi:hypothetical protein
MSYAGEQAGGDAPLHCQSNPTSAALTRLPSGGEGRFGFRHDNVS